MGWAGFFSGGKSFKRDELPGLDLVDRLAKLIDRHGVVQPGIVERIAEFLAQQAGQFAAKGHQRAARRAGVVGGHVEHVDRAVIGRLENAAPAFQPRDHRDRAALHAGRLVAHGHVEEIAQGQDPRAGGQRDGLGKIEMGQVRGLDLQHGDFQPRIAAQELGVEAAAVVQGDGDVIGVQARSSRR